MVLYGKKTSVQQWITSARDVGKGSLFAWREAVIPVGFFLKAFQSFWWTRMQQRDKPFLQLSLTAQEKSSLSYPER